MADNPAAAAIPGKVRFELVAPERRLADEAVDMVVLPGEAGDFGVLALHAPLMALLRPGVITTYQGERPDKRLFIEGGFAEVNEHGCTVLAEAAEPVDTLDRAAAQASLTEAQAAPANPELSEADRLKQDRKLRIAEARVEALAG